MTAHLCATCGEPLDHASRLCDATTCCACEMARLQPDEWSVFLAALRSAAVDGIVHQDNVRPLIRGRIEPKRIGRCYARAKREGLLVPVGIDESHDYAGKNAGRPEPRYQLREAS